MSLPREAVPSEDQSTPYTQDHFDQFYKEIIQISLRADSDANTAKRIKEYYLNYLRDVLELPSSISEQTLKFRKKQLIEEVNQFSKKNLLNNEIANLISDDMKKNGELIKQIVPEDERDYFVDHLSIMATDMTYASQPSQKPQTLTQIQSGFTLEKKHQPMQADRNDPVADATATLINQSFQLVVNKRFIEGIAKMESLIATEEMKEDKLSDDEKDALIDHKRMLARYYQAQGVHLQEHKKFDEGIASLKKSIEMVKAIHANKLADTTPDRKMYQLSLAHAYDQYASECLAQNNFRNAIKPIQASIATIKQIDTEISADNKMNLTISRRKLALATFRAGMDIIKQFIKEIDDDNELTMKQLTMNVPEGCSKAMKDVKRAITVAKDLCEDKSIEPTLRDEIELDLNCFRIGLADIYQTLTLYWGHLYQTVESMEHCKNVIDTLLPLYQKNKLDKKHCRLLEDSSKNLRNLVHMYQIQHDLPLKPEMGSAYKEAREILIAEKKAYQTSVWKILAPKVSELSDNKSTFFQVSKSINTLATQEEAKPDIPKTNGL